MSKCDFPTQLEYRKTKSGKRKMKSEKRKNENQTNFILLAKPLINMNLFLLSHFSVLFQDESLRSTNSHFVQLFPLCAGTHTLSIFNIYPLRNSRIVRYNSGIGGQSENSHFEQDNSGVVPILTLRRTYIQSQYTVSCVLKMSRNYLSYKSAIHKP